MFTDLGKTSPQGNAVITELIYLETSVVQRVGNVIQCESFTFSSGIHSLDKGIRSSSFWAKFSNEITRNICQSVWRINNLLRSTKENAVLILQAEKRKPS